MLLAILTVTSCRGSLLRDFNGLLRRRRWMRRRSCLDMSWVNVGVDRIRSVCHHPVAGFRMHIVGLWQRYSYLGAGRRRRGRRRSGGPLALIVALALLLILSPVCVLYHMTVRDAVTSAMMTTGGTAASVSQIGVRHLAGTGRSRASGWPRTPTARGALTVSRDQQRQLHDWESARRKPVDRSAGKIVLGGKGLT